MSDIIELETLLKQLEELKKNAHVTTKKSSSRKGKFTVHYKRMPETTFSYIKSDDIVRGTGYCYIKESGTNAVLRVKQSDIYTNPKQSNHIS